MARKKAEQAPSETTTEATVAKAPGRAVAVATRVKPAAIDFEAMGLDPAPYGKAATTKSE